MAKGKTDSYPVEARWVEHEVHETGQTPSVRVDRELELGVELDGVWLRFASMGEPRVEAFQRAAQAAEAREAGDETGGNGSEAAAE